MPDTREPREPEELLPLTAQELQILMILEDGPRHAYGLAQESEEAPGGVRLEIGSLYRMLNRMLGAGLIEEVPQERDRSGPAAMRRNYGITAFGRRVAEAEARRLEGVVEAARSRRILPREGG